jgi:type III restriction enzyme
MQLKEYQQTTVERLREYLKALIVERNKARQIAELGIDLKHKWDEAAWETVAPKEPYHARHTPGGGPVPNVCLKIPTGGGKTLLAVEAIDLLHSQYRMAQTGFVLWIVPTTQIYNQTLIALRDRGHPYRVRLNLASGDRALILEKNAVFTPDDVRDNLVVLLLMLPSANRQVKETLRIFKDRGGFESFFPREDDYQAHARLLQATPNLDTFDQGNGIAAATVKSSLGNTLRLLRPVIIMDEGHKAYGELAQSTLLGFNPAFILELSATPPARANKLVKISGKDLLASDMIKLDINVYNRASGDWKDTLLASMAHRNRLEQIAADHEQNAGGPYIRPICLIQVERTGAKQRDAGLIHAEDAREFLLKNGVLPNQIAVKSSEKDEIEKIDLLDPGCPIRYIVTKQALQEGWDCPFAYILTVLTNPRQASTSITQLVGRVLRQPYAKKTGIIELDESYVYCFRDKTGDVIRAVRAGLDAEGMADLAGRVVLSDGGVSRAEFAIRSQFAHLAGNVYLPCFVVRDQATQNWREVGYEMDILSRIDWDAIDLSRFDKLQLNPTRTEDVRVAVGLEGLADALRPTAAADMPLDLVLIARQVSDLVPSPWRAFEFAEAAVARLRQRYSDGLIRRDLAYVIEQLKDVVLQHRIAQAKQVFNDLIQTNELRFILLSSCRQTAVPDKISAPATAPLIDERGQQPQLSLFDYRADEFNEYERDVVLYLDRQNWVLAWARNFAKIGYSIQGWKSRVYPDFILFSGPEAEFGSVYVLETKGLYLKGNEDTAYKEELFAMCNELCRPRPWSEVSQEMAQHLVQFQIIYDDQWRQVIDQMANERS